MWQMTGRGYRWRGRKPSWRRRPAHGERVIGMTPGFNEIGGIVVRSHRCSARVRYDDGFEESYVAVVECFNGSGVRVFIRTTD